MALMTPDFLFKDVTRISPRFLREQGIRALVLDVDNTLTDHGSQKLDEDVAHWLRRMQANGIPMMLASNNTKGRVAPFAKKLGIPYTSFCCKPLPMWLMEAKRRWGLPKENIALVGDQVFTDLLAGPLYGAKVLLGRPLHEDIKPTVRFKRKLEKPLLMRYYQKGGKLL